MSIAEFCRKYNVACRIIKKLIRKQYLTENVHYTIKRNIRHDYVTILDEKGVMETILSHSKIIRGRHENITYQKV